MAKNLPTTRSSGQKNGSFGRMNMRTIARLANVSIATVSRTLNLVKTVDPKMAQRVWKVVQEVDYVPNSQARALVSGRSRTLGIIISEITNPFFPELIQGFEEVALENGYEILVGSTDSDASRISRCIRRMLERNVDGVAVLTFGIEEPLLEQLAQLDKPLVFIDTGLSRPGVSLLSVDYHGGIRQGVQHLAALGHRNIGFVAGPAALHSAKLRVAAFCRSLGECGIQNKQDWILQSDHTLEGGMAAMQRLLSLQDLPTAIMCSNDMTAIGVLHTINEKGLRVPEDISVIGFDDIHIAQVTIPPLTTIELSRFEVARAAVNELRAQLDGIVIRTGRQKHDVHTRLVVRKSTGFPRGTMKDLSITRATEENTFDAPTFA